jgi:hypothetical protein
VAFRSGPVFAVIVNVTVAAPVPNVGCNVIQSTKFCAVQLQVGPVVSPTVRWPPAASMETPFTLSEKLQDVGMDVVLLEMTVVVGSGASVANIVSVLNDSGLPLQSASVRPPVHRNVVGSIEPPNSRSAVQSTCSAVSVPLKVPPPSNVPMNCPVTFPVPPPGVT